MIKINTSTYNYESSRFTNGKCRMNEIVASMRGYPYTHKPPYNEVLCAHCSIDNLFHIYFNKEYGWIIMEGVWVEDFSEAVNAAVRLRDKLEKKS